jgi:hypothetical protein
MTQTKDKILRLLEEQVTKNCLSTPSSAACQSSKDHLYTKISSARGAEKVISTSSSSSVDLTGSKRAYIRKLNMTKASELVNTPIGDGILDAIAFLK